MSAVIRTGQRFGAGHVIDVLAGRRTPRMIDLGHDELPTFGVGADLDDRTWRAVTRQLVAQGLLHSDASAYGALRLTEAARQVLRGESEVQLRRPSDPPAKRTRVRTAGSGSPVRADAATADLDEADTALFERLRAARRTIADEQGVPAYVVFHDATLRAIALARPADDHALLAIAGIGQAKLDRYGERILEVVRAAVPNV